ncbi:hypothetical protein OEV98_14330 [Caldibacillus lycopersici]|uniref:Uncharacterized protein n=1 Tax=Perspicuibacillus lycopersici TaxID=1325689 RepID=A0AAE3IV11_9BACI|nr:hypothetical protein [Perspicuibacillus lycopersici]MCU9614717.1 hypothetical protein [Perspicuibacillus lycopersici]
MNSVSKLFKGKNDIPEKNAYKIGKPVKGVKGIVPSKNGKEESGLVIYKRKAEYKFNG